MNALVVYDSQFGNTERIARTIADRLGTTRIARATEVTAYDLATCDLLLVGGPTQRHQASQALRTLLEELPRHALARTPAAAFDTRYRMSSLLSGSAAEWIARRLKHADARLVLPPESFFMQRDIPPKGEKRRHEVEHLEIGEEERAAAWADSLQEATALRSDESSEASYTGD